MMHHTLNTDDQILALLKADDEHAMTLMFENFYLLLKEALRSYITQQEDIDELIHDLMINIWLKRHTLNITKPIARYVLKAALNRARNHIRNQVRTKERVSNHFRLNDLQSDLLDIPADSAVYVEEINALLNRALNNMSIKMKLCFQLSRNYKMTYPQIANFLGISVKSVEKNISNALKILTPLFRPYLK